MEIWVLEYWSVTEAGILVQFSHLGGVSVARVGVAQLATDYNNEAQTRNMPLRAFVRPYITDALPARP
jgi:hypothetical protein